MNRVTKSLCDTWQWPGKYLKLILRDVGEIDFLNAPSYIDNPTYQLKFGERSIAAERSAEIATKKLVYRASTYTPRDAFDLAAIQLHDRAALGEDRAISGHHPSRRVVRAEPVESRERPVSSRYEEPDQRDAAGRGVHRQSLRDGSGGACRNLRCDS